MSKHEEIDLHVISKNIRDGTIKTENMTIHYIKFYKKYFIGELIHALNVRKKIYEINPTIIHYQGISPYPLFCMKKHWLITIHGFFTIEVPLRFKDWKYVIYGLPRILIEKFVLLKVKNIIAVSPYITEIIESKFNNKNAVTIPNGIDDDFFNIKYKEIPNTLLFVGNIEHRKGVFELVKSIKILTNFIPSLKLTIIGKKTNIKYFKKIMNFIKCNNLINNVIYKGVISKKDLLKEYQKSSIFILPSKIEPFGIVLLEAMASGKPIVATKVGGIPYIVKESKTGFLVKEGDINDLVNKILMLLKNKDLRYNMGQKGQVRAKEFSWQVITQNTLNLYNKILKD